MQLHDLSRDTQTQLATRLSQCQHIDDVGSQLQDLKASAVLDARQDPLLPQTQRYLGDNVASEPSNPEGSVILSLGLSGGTAGHTKTRQPQLVASALTTQTTVLPDGPQRALAAPTHATAQQQNQAGRRKTYREQYLDEMQARVNDAAEKYVRRNRRRKKEKSTQLTSIRHGPALNQS